MQVRSFNAFEQNFFGGVRLAACDLNGDSKTEIIAARGPLGQPQVRTFDGATGTPLGSFLAFNSSFRGGVYIACGKISGDTIPDFIATRGGLDRPEVRVFDGTNPALLLRSFDAFISSFRGGVRVAACDLNQDGTTDILAGRGPGAQPEVRAFNGLTGAAFPAPLGSFPAFGTSFRGGVYVACSPSASGANDPPAPSGGPFSIPENSATGTPVGTVAANDPDAGQTHAFAITGGNTGSAFAINPSTGAITVNNSAALDFETTPSFSLTVEATDDGSPPETGSTTVTINLTDVNENQAPVPSGGPFSLPENSLNGTSVGTVAANDPDAGQTHTFAITGGNTGGAFAINGGGQITVANSAALNFEATASFSLTVQVTDSGSPPLSGTASVTVNLTNVNEPPVATAKTHQTHSGIRVTIGTGDSGKLKDGATDPDADDTFGTLIVTNIANETPGGPGVTTVTLTDPATGTFTFNPQAGLSGNGISSFTFDVCDDGVPSLCDTETVTFNITGPDLWFVDAGAAAGGSGRLTNPFNTLASLPAGRGSNDRIFAFTGTYPTGLTLLTGEHLIGQGSSSTFDSVLGVTVPGNGTLDTRLALAQARPQLNGTVTVGGSSTVRGLNIASTTATGLSGGAVTGVNVSEVSVTSTTGTAVNLSGTGGTVVLTSVSSNGGTTPGISLSNTTGSFTVTGSGSAACTSAATCTGGSIINKAGPGDGTDGITLSSATNVSLTRMNISDNNGSGIRGNSVNGFKLDNCFINSNADQLVRADLTNEANIHLTNISGTLLAGSNPTSITNSTITNAFEHDIEIDHTTGTLADFQINNSTISNNGASSQAVTRSSPSSAVAARPSPFRTAHLSATAPPARSPPTASVAKLTRPARST